MKVKLTKIDRTNELGIEHRNELGIKDIGIAIDELIQILDVLFQVNNFRLKLSDILIDLGDFEGVLVNGVYFLCILFLYLIVPLLYLCNGNL